MIEEPKLIINQVADYFNLLPENVICTERKREYIKAKHIAMYAFRTFTNLSLREIGYNFNNKDHATVLHAIKSVNDQRSIYQKYRNELDNIMHIIENKIDFEFDKYRNYDTDKV
ncbi:hypothetical protein D4R86_04235 [bacterium]|nr:MAG: hypothetical protein D4R86_04235 [bacterium]